MAHRFTRNIRDVDDVTKFDVGQLSQNDLLSDKKDVYVMNNGKVQKLTSDVEEGYIISLELYSDGDNIIAESLALGDYSETKNTHYALDVYYEDNNFTSTRFIYEKEKNVSSATITFTPEMLENRVIDHIQVAEYMGGNVTIISSKRILHADWNESKPNSPSFIKNKSVGGLTKIVDSKNALLLGDELPIIAKSGEIATCVIEVTHEEPSIQEEFTNNFVFQFTLKNAGTHVIDFSREIGGTRQITGNLFIALEEQLNVMKVTVLESSLVFRCNLVGIYA